MHPIQQEQALEALDRALTSSLVADVFSSIREAIAALSSAAPAAGEEAPISPGKYQTRGGKEVYIACRCAVKPDGTDNDYPWWVEDGKRGWSVDDMGRHLKTGTSEFDIVSRLPPTPSATSADLAHQVWSAAQLVPGEGIEAGVERIAALLQPTVMDEKGEHAAFQKWWKDEHGDRVPTDKEWQAFRAGLRATLPAAQPEAETSAERDDSKPLNKADIRRVLTEWNDVTGALPVGGSWFYEVEGMMEDAFECGAGLADAPVAEPVALPTDEQIEETFRRLGAKWDGDAWVIQDADLHPIYRAIAAHPPAPEDGKDAALTLAQASAERRGVCISAIRNVLMSAGHKSHGELSELPQRVAEALAKAKGER